MPNTDRLLVLVRHGQSEWNLKNLFTGWRDVDLSAKGVEEASAAGRRLKAQELSFDLAFTSALIRAQNTLKLVLAAEALLELRSTHGPFAVRVVLYFSWLKGLLQRDAHSLGDGGGVANYRHTSSIT